MAENPILEAAEVYREAVRQAQEADALVAELNNKADAAEALRCKSWSHVAECKDALAKLARDHG